MIEEVYEMKNPQIDGMTDYPLRPTPNPATKYVNEFMSKIQNKDPIFARRMLFTLKESDTISDEIHDKLEGIVVSMETLQRFSSPKNRYTFKNKKKSRIRNAQTIRKR